MRNYRKAIRALTLALVLAVPASAGIMHTDKASPTPTPVPAAAAMTTDAADGEGIIHSDLTSPTSDASDVVAEIALSLLQSVLTLF